MKPIKLIAPATTSNLGPGFDALGMALSLHLELQASARGEGIKIVLPEQEGGWGPQVQQMIEQTIEAWQTKTGIRVRGLHFEFRGRIPLARGLGSSAAYRLGVLAAVNRLTGSPLSDSRLLELGARLENHTDNAAPCMVGGLTVSGFDRSRVRVVKCEVSDRFKFIALIPDRAVSTDEARSLLPAQVPREDAVFNLQRALWLWEGLAHDRPELLCRAFEDRLHQPSREKLVPFLPAVIRAAEEAGAYGAFLSGSGSTMIAVAEPARAEAVAKAMLAALEAREESGAVTILSADNQGLRFIEE